MTQFNSYQPTYEETLQYLYSRLPVFQHEGKTAYKPGLENTIQLLNKLGNPQEKYRCIHIAGTNGKGSVSHMLAAILQAAGYKVGLYTSPHLVDFGERIRVNGQKIDRDYVIRFVENSQSMFDAIEPSFFEATMAMAFQYFADKEVDISVVEVGLGGRLDSTNIIHPILSIITNISFDHMNFLGNTLPEIAFEKAGIIKKNTPVIVGETLPETIPVFKSKAEAEKAPLYFSEEHHSLTFVNYCDGNMIVEDKNGQKFTLGLNGKYQLKNLASVLLAVELIRSEDLKITDKALNDGLLNVVNLTGLQGRWQLLNASPKVIADTGHNEAGIRFVVEQLKAQTYQKLHFVLGMVNDKDITTVLKLLPRDAIYYFTNAAIARALPAVELKEKAANEGLQGDAFQSVESAVKAALKKAGKDDLIFIGGSNFIVGEAIPLFGNQAHLTL